jgi:hypothetical protein
LRRRQTAQLPDGRGRHAVPSDVLRDPVAEYRGAVLDVIQAEPAQDRAILGDEYVEGADAGLLIVKQGAAQLGEPVKVLIPPVRGIGGEVSAICQLEGEDRLGIVGSQALQLWHSTTLRR